MPTPDAKTYTVRNIAGDSVGEIELSSAVFDAEVHEHLLWECVKWQLAKRRAGTHSTKTRSEVVGSKKKPWRQKGTGRARAGSTHSAQWVGGGRIFGPRPRSYEYAMPRKARKKALRAALSLRAREQKLVILDSFPVAEGQTKNVVSVLGVLGVPQPAKSALIVDASDNQELVRGTRNLRSSKWLAPEGVHVYDILNHETRVLPAPSVKAVEAALQP